MKTIQIDRKDEEGLKALLRAGGFVKYAERIATASSFMDPGGSWPPAGYKPFVYTPDPPPCSYERANGPSGLITDWQYGFATTGLIESFTDLKARGAKYEEVSLVGWFRAPDGHLCEAGCYPKYLQESV